MKLILLTFGLFSHYFAFTQQIQIKIPMTNGNDDIEKSTDFYPASSDLELGGFDSYNGGTQYVALRFQNINLPTNAQISKAYIQFTTKDVNTQTANLTIKCQQGNATSYISTENLLLRTYAAPVVTWSPSAWTVAAESGVNQQTTNLATQIQSAIATGWVSGDALSFVLQGNATTDNVLNARSYEHNATHAGAPELVIEYSISSSTLTIPIANGNDDVEISTNFSATSSDLELGGFDSYNAGAQYVALRFQNINLPTNAQISKAYIQFTTKDIKTQTANLTIKCQQGNAASYISTENLLQRTYVTPVVTWNPPAWTVAAESGVNQQTTNLAAQIQSAIATNWTSGNALSFILQGNAITDNVLNARSYENNATHAGAPELVIEYTLGTNPCSPDVLPPTITNCPANIPLTTTGTTAVATWTVPTITDNCTTNITPSVLSAPIADLTLGSAFPLGTTTITYNAKDAANNNALPCVFAVTVAATNSTTLRIPIVNGNDDVEISTQFLTTSSDLELGGFDASNNGAQYVALRFQNIGLPANAQITKAYIQFTVKSVFPATTNMTIKCQQGNAAAYNPTENLLQRTYVTPIVTWNPPAWTVLDASGENQQTANLAAQIMLATGGVWQPGNALSFILQGNATTNSILNARSYEHNAAHLGAPELVIEYSTVTTPATALFINEVAPQGTTAIASDWIELYNDAPTAVSLNDVFITNKKNTPYKFPLTGLTIPGKGFLVLLADNEPTLGNTHLNFKVGASGEKLYLYRNVNGTAVEIAFLETPPMSFEEENVTVGGLTEGVIPTSLTKFFEGTPGAANASATRFIKMTNSLQRGIQLAAGTATLTAPAGTTIRYTTDFSMPSRTNGTIYTQPINISTSTVLKTIAYSSNSESKVGTFSYIFPVKGPELLYPDFVTPTEFAEGMKQLPIVSVSANVDSVDSVTEKLGSFEYINKFGENLSIGILGGIEAYGSGSLNLAQRNMRISFKKEYGYGSLEYPIFKKDDVDTYNPTTKFDRLDLKIGQDGPSSASLGMTMTSQGLISKTMREMGNIDLHTQYAHVYVNAKYHGIYILKEHFDPHFGETYYGGDSDSYDFVESNWKTGRISLDSEGNPQGNLTNWTAMRTVAQQNNYQGLKAYLNIKQYVDNMLNIMYFDNEWEFRAFADQALSATKFVFENHDPDGALRKGIDNYTFAGIGNYEQKWMTSDPAFQDVFFGPGRIFDFLYQNNTNVNKEFRTLVRDRVYEAFQKPNGALTVGRITTKLNELKAVIRPVFNMELARFNATFTNNNPYFDQEFDNHIAQLPARFQYNLDKWLEKGLKHTLLPVTFNQASGTVTTPVLATNPNPNGVIYYTLDGSDPMGNDGVISSVAKLYTNKLTLNIGVNNVVARVYFNEEFGPKTTATYTSATVILAAQTAEILSVNGRLDGQKAVVSWITKTTQAVDYFEVQKLKTNGAYQTVQTVNARYSDNPTGLEQYNFTDEKLNEGENTYRIALFSGVLRTPQYSDPVTVKFIPADSYTLYPNPTSDYFDIDLKSVEGQSVSIFVFNSIGTIVFNEKIEKTAGTKRVNIEALSTGHYSVLIQPEGKKRVIKKMNVVR